MVIVNRSQATKRADRLFSERVRAVGVCQINAGPTRCNGALQCCHILSRRYRAIRWNAGNALAGCAAHHLYFTNHPLEWEEFCRDQGVAWDALRRTALSDPPMDPFAVIEELEVV